MNSWSKMGSAVMAVLLMSLMSWIGMSTVTCLAEQPALSIAELNEQTPQRWTQTYEAKGRDQIVYVAIEIPQVDTCPIFTTTFPESSEVDSSVPEYYQPLEHTRNFGFRNDKYLFGIGINSSFWPVEGKGNQAYPQKHLNAADIDWNSAYAEN
ncbi:MAG: hypothetical protein RSC98_02600, partial [Clostridia bacterium]